METTESQHELLIQDVKRLMDEEEINSVGYPKFSFSIKDFRDCTDLYSNDYVHKLLADIGFQEFDWENLGDVGSFFRGLK